MLRVHATIFRELDRALLAGHGFGVDAYAVLITLVGAPEGKLAIGELGERINLTPSGVSRAVDRLARSGLLERTPNPDDGRSLLVVWPPGSGASAGGTGHPPRNRALPVVGAAGPDGPQTPQPSLGEGHARVGLKPRLAAPAGVLSRRLVSAVIRRDPS